VLQPGEPTAVEWTVPNPDRTQELQFKLRVLLVVAMCFPYLLISCKVGRLRLILHAQSTTADTTPLLASHLIFLCL